MLPQALELVRSLSFGAMVANAVALMLFLYHPEVFPNGVTYKEVMAISTLLGTVTHRALNAALFNPLARNIGRTFIYYIKLYQLGLDREKGFITEDEFQLYSRQLKDYYYGFWMDEPLKPSSPGVPLTLSKTRTKSKTRHESGVRTSRSLIAEIAEEPLQLDLSNIKKEFAPDMEEDEFLARIRSGTKPKQ